MIAVDTNILAYLYLSGDHTAAAEALLQHDADWAAPLLWRSEFRNILAGCMRRGALTLEQAYAIQREAEDLLHDAEYEVDSFAVLELAQNSGCTAYDCEFVALAQQLNTRLITMDSQLLRAFPDIARALTQGRS